MSGTYEPPLPLEPVDADRDLTSRRCCGYTLVIHESYKVLIFGILISWFMFSVLVYMYYTQSYNIREYVLYIFLFVLIVIDYIMIHFYIQVRRRAILQNFLHTHVHPKMAYETQM